MNLKEKRFGFETELMIRSLRDKNTRYGECDVSYLPRRKTEGKKIRISDGIGITGKTLRYGLEGKRWLSAMTIAFIITFMTINMLSVKFWKEEQRVIEWDAISYYAYLPAAFIYNDLSLGFADNYNGPHKFIFWPEKGPDGQHVIKTTMGLSVLWLPFFIAGHLTALITGADAGGYSGPYKFFLLISALFYLMTGLIYLRRIILTQVSDLVTSLILAGFAFGTNLYWYTLFQGTMAHVYSFALISVFVWYSMEWHGAIGRRGEKEKGRKGEGRNGRSGERKRAIGYCKAGIVAGTDLTHQADKYYNHYFLPVLRSDVGKGSEKQDQGTGSRLQVHFAHDADGSAGVGSAADLLEGGDRPLAILFIWQRGAVLLRRPGNNQRPLQLAKRAIHLHSAPPLLINGPDHPLEKTFTLCSPHHIIYPVKHLYYLFLVVLVVWRRLRPESLHRQLRTDGGSSSSIAFLCFQLRQEMAEDRHCRSVPDADITRDL